MPSHLSFVLDYMLHAKTPPGFRPDALRPTIAAERKEVETYLDSDPAPRVYGFNTLLGQRDDTDATREDQTRLLDAHLRGRVFELDEWSYRAVSASKVLQLANGGSGVSPETFDLLLENLERNDLDRQGAWWDYYGAGDVVPASWWINSQLGQEPAAGLPRGDLIALMNGTFVSTGMTVATVCRALDAMADMLWVLSISVPPPAPGMEKLSGLTRAFTSVAQVKRASVDEQKSVAMRDSLPFLRAAESAAQAVSKALEDRLGMPSVNPYFAFKPDGRVDGHYSQSSFLDLPLSSALLMLLDSLSFLAAGVQGVLKDGAADAEPERILVPKITEVLINEMSEIPSARFSICESGGVEDVCDRTLARTQAVGAQTERARELVELYVQQQAGREDGRARATGLFVTQLRALLA